MTTPAGLPSGKECADCGGKYGKLLKPRQRYCGSCARQRQLTQRLDRAIRRTTANFQRGQP